MNRELSDILIEHRDTSKECPYVFYIRAFQKECLFQFTLEGGHTMTNTALGAGAEKVQKIIFISEAHEKFYYEKLKEVRYQDVYHKALVYCLGISNDTRRNVKKIYDFKTGCVKTECLHEGWQTSGSIKVVRMAFNLYCNGTPSVSDYEDTEEQVDECKQYTVEELFCCAYAPYFWQAIQIRYPEYATYNKNLYALFGGAD